MGRVRAPDRLRAGLGEPDVPDLAFVDELGERADRLLDRRVGIDAMLVEEVDGVDPQTLQRGIRDLPDAFGAAVEPAGSAVTEVMAEITANVWQVPAEVGQQVAEGDTLVILESMKMEIPVIAEVDGVVSKMAVKEGDVVQEGDLIAVVE